MKKIIITLSACAAACLVINTANAQSMTSKKSDEATKQETVTEAPANKQTLTSEERLEIRQKARKEEELKKIADYEAKIKANENNPDFDKAKAQEELARLKREAGVATETKR